MHTHDYVLLLVGILVACTAPAPADDHPGVKFKEVTFTDASTPSFNAPCPLAPPGSPNFSRVDTGTVEGQLPGTILACLQCAPGLVPQSSGFFQIATDDVTWTGTFQAFVTPTFPGESDVLATGEYFGDGEDGTKLRGSFTQFQIGTGKQPDRYLNRAIIIRPSHHSPQADRVP